MSLEEIKELSKQARERIENRQFTDAEYFFKKITKLDKTNWQAWHGRGLCFKRLEMYERAIYAFSKVVELQPESAKACYNLGFCQSQLDKLEDALYNLNKAINLDSSYAIARVIKAWIYLNHNNEHTALKLLDYVRQKNPEFMLNLEVENAMDEPKDLQIAIELMKS